MSKTQKLLSKYPEIHFIKKDEIEGLSQMMTDRFLEDPCTMLQLDGVEKSRARELFYAQCKGQIFAFSDKKVVYTLDDCGGLFIGYSDQDLPNWRLVSVVMQSGRFVRRTLSKPESEVLKENAEYLNKISPGNWHTKYISGDRFHILAIAIDRNLKGSGAFSRLITPVLEVCDQLKLPITMEIHNEANMPIYEHFGFERKEVIENELMDVRCICLIRFPKG